MILCENPLTNSVTELLQEVKEMVGQTGEDEAHALLHEFLDSCAGKVNGVVLLAAQLLINQKFNQVFYKDDFARLNNFSEE